MFRYVYPTSNIVWSKIHTLDNYRAYLIKIKVLDTTNKKGIYIKKSNIPKSLSLSQLKKIAYDNSWESWFIPIEDRIW
jgi:hypothetical protein